MVYRIYVEKRPGFDVEAQGLLEELRSLLDSSKLKRKTFFFIRFSLLFEIS